jgi:hypothetical protein
MRLVPLATPGEPRRQPGKGEHDGLGEVEGRQILAM